MAEDLERLIVKLDADLRSYEKNLAKAQGVTISKLRAISQAAEKEVSRIDRAFGNVGKSIGASFRNVGTGLLAGFTAKAFIDALAGAVNSIAELGELSDKVGITTDSLQALHRMAVLTGAGVDEMDKALQSLAEQAAESGSFLDKLFSANDVKLSKDMTANVRSFMTLMRNAANEQERLLIATKVFGDRVGRQLVEAFSQGGEAVDRVFREMLAAGEIHSKGQIEEMRKVRDEYNRIMDKIAVHWQETVIKMVGATAGLATAMGGILNDAKDAASFVARVLQNPGGNTATRVVPNEQGGFDMVNEDNVFPNRHVSHPPNPTLGSKTRSTVLPLTPEEVAAAKAAQAERDRALKDELEKRKRAYADTEQTINDLMVQSQKDRTEAELAALQKTIDKLDEVRSVAQDMFQGVLQGIKDGASAGEILNGILEKLESKMIDLASTGFADLLFGAQGTAGGGFLGKLLGSGFKTFARGGVSRSPAIFAEHGPEAAVPLPDGRRIPVDLRLPSTARLPSRGAGGPTISVKIENHAGAQISTQMGRGINGPELLVMVRSATDRNLAEGRHDKTLGGRFGIGPTSRRRT